MRPIIFGEVLFDVFNDDQKVLGGAPFNVAWNLKGLGLDPLFISRIGSDQDGNKILDIMKQWQMDTSGIQIDPDYPTGKVEIKTSGNSHSFDILPDQAYDFIEMDPIKSLIKNIAPSIFYHGSLIARKKNSIKIINKLKANLKCPSFIDINLRKPWYNLDEIVHLIKNGNWLKLNIEELEEITQENITKTEIKNKTQTFLNKYGLDFCIVTMAENGALVVSTSGESLQTGASKPGTIKDTVGAGDAFSSMIIYCQMHNWHLDKSLALASEFAGRICSIQGATSMDRQIYNYADKK